MTQTYICFLRGINVGGNSLIKMADLKAAVERAGFENVKTYIQSGNLFVDTSETDHEIIGQRVHDIIVKSFDLQVDVAVFSKREWQKVIVNKPEWWGKNPEWKHNMLILTKPVDPRQAMQEIGELRLEIENAKPGNRVIYQSVSFKKFGRSRFSKIVMLPVYKQITIRNYNTATKIATLFSV
jgi:uncharacterized protein (DUF1697 family)